MSIRCKIIKWEEKHTPIKVSANPRALTQVITGYYEIKIKCHYHNGKEKFDRLPCIFCNGRIMIDTNQKETLCRYLK